MNALRLVVTVVWILFCILGAIQGFAGQMAPFYAGLGWLLLALLVIMLVYVYYKLDKAIKEMNEED